MEKNYLCPGEGVTPLEIGNGYKDYLLSDILSANGYGIYLIQVDSFLATTLSISVQWHVLLRVCFRRGGLNGLGIGDSILLFPLRMVGDGERIFGKKQLTDVVVRYFYDDHEVVNIVWVSAIGEDGIVYSFK